MNDHPSHPPSISPPRKASEISASSANAIITFAREVTTMSSEERAQAIAILPDELADWNGFLYTLFGLAPHNSTDGDEPEARALLAHAERLGMRREPAKSLIAALIDTPTLHGHWTTWTQTIDRDELRLRLEILARSAHWDEAFAPFVTFFFRASVADLYQHAAIALGRHLHHSAKLREYLADFAAQRSVPMNQPVRLNGSRTPRRMMIALASARSNPPRETAIALEAVPTEETDDGRTRFILPQHPADLATVLLALEVMVAGNADDEELIRRSRDVITSVSHMDTAALSRAVVQRFGGLLVRCGGEDTESDWSRLVVAQLAELHALSDGRFGRRVAGLVRLDELLRCGSVLPDPWPERIARRLRELPNQLERRFVTARLITWAQREHGPLPPWAESLMHEATESPPAVSTSFAARLSPAGMVDAIERSVRAKIGRSEPIFAAAADETDIDLLDQLLREIETPATWMSHDEPERAVLATVMIDLAQYTHPPAEQMAALLDRHGFAPAAEARTAARSANVAMTSILLRLLTWEKPGAEELIDVRMLHRIDDPRVLLALIPTQRRSPLLPVLADAIEHQLRWRLRRDERFSPDILLALTQVRQPHPTLYHALHALCEGRTYRRVDGSEIALLPLVDRVRDDGERGEAALPDTVADATTPCAKSRHRLRERLRKASEPHDDLRLRIESLLDAVGEVAAARTARTGTVIDMLQLLHEPERPMLQDGYPAWSEQTLSSFLRDLEADLVRMKALTHALLPEDWRGSDEVREAAAGLRSLLDRRMSELARSLPQPEAESLRSMSDELDRELAAWSAMIESVMDRWPESALRTGAGVNFIAASEALNAIGRIDLPLLRRHLLTIFWHALRQWSTPAAGQDGDAWSMQQRLLDEAMKQPPVQLAGTGASSANHTNAAMHWSEADRQLALAAFVGLWSELAEQAMDRHEEQRVIELSTDPRYEPLRCQPAAQDVLSAIRKWCHDRYLLRPAASVRRDMRVAAPDARQSPPRIAHEVWSLLANFPTIWLAMLIGAIFMLDFGDAWSAMADPDVADIRGITITFLIGIGGAFGYVLYNLKQKSRLAPGQSASALRRSQLIRAGAFSAVCLIYTLLLVSGLWWLLSETDEVVQGGWAIGHIIVWSGFALFVGVFFGLLAGDA